MCSDYISFFSLFFLQLHSIFRDLWYHTCTYDVKSNIYHTSGQSNVSVDLFYCASKTMLEK
jgi:hypothetical protein